MPKSRYLINIPVAFKGKYRVESPPTYKVHEVDFEAKGVYTRELDVTSYSVYLFVDSGLFRAATKETEMYAVPRLIVTPGISAEMLNKIGAPVKVTVTPGQLNLLHNKIKAKVTVSVE